MRSRLVQLSAEARIATNWQAEDISSNLILNQDIHIQQVIADFSDSRICNYTKFPRWDRYCNIKTVPCDLALYAHTNWLRLSNLVKDIESIDCNYIFIAINKYLILPEQFVYNQLVDDYDQAIYEFLKNHLLNFKILDYQYHCKEDGDIGNFISPDNRLLCKKI